MKIRFVKLALLALGLGVATPLAAQQPAPARMQYHMTARQGRFAGARFQGPRRRRIRRHRRRMMGYRMHAYRSMRMRSFRRL